MIYRIFLGLFLKKNLQAVLNAFLQFFTFIIGKFLFSIFTPLEHMTAAAPLFIASLMKSLPLNLSPSIAKNKLPFLTLRLSKARVLISIDRNFLFEIL